MDLGGETTILHWSRGLVFTIIGRVIGARVLYIVNISGGVASGTALVSMLCIVVGVFSMFTGILHEIVTHIEHRFKPAL